jgi:hypothetical protein
LAVAQRVAHPTESPETHEGLPSSGSPSIIEPGSRFRLQKRQAAATSIETKIQVAEALPGM